ncbi:hypothetical protein ACSBPU_08825 [Parapusillimonas sp. JC17]|uniref:hypothetical protein n=1 Tax=Parapusillimonas sp. JC17 TaxID=3445768 RepID=UPI003FA0EB41
MAQVDHLVDTGTEKVIGGRAGKHRNQTPRKQPLLDNKPGVPGIGNCPNHQCLCGLRGLFKADYVGKFIKNPLSSFWKTIRHNAEYDLEDFKEYIDTTPIRKRQNLVWDALGRNSTLFNNLRFWAYPTVKHYLNNHAGFISAVEEQAFEINSQFISQSDKGSLLHKEVLSTATSVSGYTWRNRYGDFRRKGIMQLPEDMPQKQKESLGACYTNKVRSQSVKEKIVQAVAELKAQGTPITQKSVSIRAECSIDSVKRSWNEVGKQFNLYA